RVPGGFHSNLGRQPVPYNKDWFVGVAFHQKTGLIAVPNFVRIFPVDGSDRTSNLLNSVRVLGTPQAIAEAPVAMPTPATLGTEAVQAISPGPASTKGLSARFNIGGALGKLNITVGGGNAKPAAVASPATGMSAVAAPPPLRAAGTVKRPGADFGKISMDVAIKDPKPLYRPGDVLAGELTLLNKQREKDGDVKPTKVKSVEVCFWEHVPLDEHDIAPFTFCSDYDNVANGYKGKIVGRSISIDAWKGVELGAEPVTLPFSVQVPGGFHSNLGRQPVPYNKDWFVGIIIFQKTGLVPKPGFARIVPVEGSDRESDLFNDLAPFRGQAAIKTQVNQGQLSPQPAGEPLTITPHVETPSHPAREDQVIVSRETATMESTKAVPIAPMVPVSAIFLEDEEAVSIATSMDAQAPPVLASTPSNGFSLVSASASIGANSQMHHVDPIASLAPQPAPAELETSPSPAPQPAPAEQAMTVLQVSEMDLSESSRARIEALQPKLVTNDIPQLAIQPPLVATTMASPSIPETRASIVPDQPVIIQAPAPPEALAKPADVKPATSREEKTRNVEEKGKPPASKFEPPKPVRKAFTWVTLGLLIPICLAAYTLIGLAVRLAWHVNLPELVPIPHDLELYRLWFWVGVPFIGCAATMLGTSARARNTMRGKSKTGVSASTIGLIIILCVALVMGYYPMVFPSFKGIPGPWIITPLFYASWRPGMIALAVMPLAGIIAGILFVLSLRKNGYTNEASPAEYHVSLQKKWGCGVPIPLQEIAMQFDMKPSKVLLMVKNWVKTGVRLKLDPVANTVILED
ncbi:MAG: hypothetical protein GYA24_13440, partial [Candidatus Lokiarchaeota archaeon]|nr:hypothetical protein [Candidatus Lokiarchaeota archaeon]